MRERTGATPVAVSAAVADLIRGAEHRATVLGVSAPAVHLGVDHVSGVGSVLTLVTSDVAHPPNGLVHPARRAEHPFAAVRRGMPASIGRGVVRVGSLEVTTARCFPPRPVLADVAVGALAARVTAALPAIRAGAAASGVLTERVRRFGEALVIGDRVAEAADRLLGWGGGLTPAGDDVLAGALAALHLFGGDVRRVADPVLPVAADRTTALSAALLAHAERGEVTSPAARLLRSLCRGGGTEQATAALLALGHSSGPALALGLTAGIRAVLAAGAPHTPGDRTRS